MPEQSAFDYAVVRVVPAVEREEFVNVGIILFCRTRHFLQARLHFDPQRLAALDPTLDLEIVREHLELIPRISAGGHDAGALGELSQSERFHWLVAPRSTVIQVSPVHGGVTQDPQAALDDLFERLVVERY
jgi:hypothetical protein